jgi:hypothetical protein
MFSTRLPPHPGPLPWGEGECSASLGGDLCAGKFSGRKVRSPLLKGEGIGISTLEGGLRVSLPFCVPGRSFVRKEIQHRGVFEPLFTGRGGVEIAAGMADDQLLALHEALDRLAALDAAKAELVKLRFFIGLTIEEAARLISVPPR